MNGVSSDNRTRTRRYQRNAIDSRLACGEFMCRQQRVGYPPHMTTTDISRDGLTMTDFLAADVARSRLLANVAERSGRYLTQLHERRVEPSEEALAALKDLDVPLQD